MSESKFLKNSIVSPGQNKVENAIKNLYIYKNCVEVVNEQQELECITKDDIEGISKGDLNVISSMFSIEVDWIDTSSGNIEVNYKPEDQNQKRGKLQVVRASPQDEDSKD